MVGPWLGCSRPVVTWHAQVLGGGSAGTFPGGVKVLGHNPLQGEVLDRTLFALRVARTPDMQWLMSPCVWRRGESATAQRCRLCCRLLRPSQFPTF